MILFSGFCILLPPLTGHASDAGQVPKSGLLWLRSDLPAVFPLQVKTTPERDYHLTLINSETRQETLSAYIEGGDFFRVLVPPGTYFLRFVHGRGWQNDADSFADVTQIFEMSTALQFGIRGIGTKGGHLVDLRALDETNGADLTTPLAICQIVRVEMQETPETDFDPGFDETGLPDFATIDIPRRIPRYVIYSRLCD